MQKLEDYILTFENAIDLTLCDSIISEFSNEDEWEKTKIGEGKIHEDVRSATTISMSFPHVINKNEQVRKELDRQIFESAGKAIQKYNERFPFTLIQEDTGYEILRYKEGQFYRQHTDSFKSRPREVSCSFALNDNYEGGEWGFFDRELKYKIKKGSCIMFPSNFMYPHEIMPVTSGTRYSVITWFL